MLIVLQPPNATWPQAIPRLTPWVPCVSTEQSLCEWSGASTPDLHPWYHHLFPSINDEEIHLAIMVLHMHIHGRLSLCVVTPKTCLLNLYIKKHTKNLIIQKLKSGFRILYLCLRRPLLVVGEYLGLRRSLSLHRGSHLWRWSISSTMERNLLGKG